MKRDVDDDDDVVPDHGVVRVPMWLSDAASRREVAFDARDHQPHYGNVPAAVRDARMAARDAYVSALTRAWRRTPGHDAGQPDNSSPAVVMRARLRTEPDDDAQARRDRAWADYCDRVGNAWRTERESERWRGGR